MQRVVYCPNRDLLEEAELLARQTQLQIILGVSKNMESLSFDRDKVQTLKIPEKFEFFIYKEEIKIGLTQCAILIDEYNIIRNNVVLKDNGIEIKPLFQEQHIIKYSFEPVTIGNHTLTVHFGDKIVANGTYSVYI